mgnify:CR=1 FL=1
MPLDEPDEAKKEVMSWFGYKSKKPNIINLDEELSLHRKIRTQKPKENKIGLYKQFIKTCKKNEILAQNYLKKSEKPLTTDLEKYIDLRDIDISPRI